MVHDLDGQQHGKFRFGLLFGHGKSQVQLVTPGEEIFEDLVDRILIDAGPTGNQSTDGLSDTSEESHGGHVAGKRRRIGEQSAEISIVNRGAIDAIVSPLLLVMLTQGLAQML
jgi:hypothetical protein